MAAGLYLVKCSSSHHELYYGPIDIVARDVKYENDTSHVLTSSFLLYKRVMSGKPVILVKPD